MDRGPEPIAEILSRLFVQRGWGRRQEQARVEQAWEQVAGPEFAQITRVSAFRRGIVEVEVDHATTLQELASFHRKRMLRELQTILTGMNIKDLRFRVTGGQR